MVSGAQIRSARSLLGVSAQELADLAGVGWATLQRLEASDGVSSSRAGTLELVVKALEAEGIEFIGDPDKSPGVRLHRKRR